MSSTTGAGVGASVTAAAAVFFDARLRGGGVVVATSAAADLSVARPAELGFSAAPFFAAAGLVVAVLAAFVGADSATAAPLLAADTVVRAARRLGDDAFGDAVLLAAVLAAGLDTAVLLAAADTMARFGAAATARLDEASALTVTETPSCARCSKNSSRWGGGIFAVSNVSRMSPGDTCPLRWPAVMSRITDGCWSKSSGSARDVLKTQTTSRKTV